MPAPFTTRKHPTRLEHAGPPQIAVDRPEVTQGRGAGERGWAQWQSPCGHQTESEEKLVASPTLASRTEAMEAIAKPSVAHRTHRDSQPKKAKRVAVGQY